MHPMRAIVITRPGSPDVLELRDVAMPVAGSNQVLVRVHATAVNRADLLQRVGGYPAPAGVPPDIPGLEYAGTVEAVGAGVTRWRAGARVMGIVGGGSYADYIVTHEDEAVHIPDALSFTQAAAVPEAFTTAHDALFTQMRLQPDETLLIHAVGSGVGTAALQLARAHGARVIGTQRSAWKLERARSLGLDVAIDTGRGGSEEMRNGAPGGEEADAGVSFVDAVLRATEGRGADGILDLVGGSYLNENLRALAVKGRILLVGLVAGSRSELDMRLLLRRRASITGTVLRARSQAEKIDAARALERDVLPLLESGAVSPIIDDVMPLDRAADAHRIIEANRNFGKIVLTVVPAD